MNLAPPVRRMRTGMGERNGKETPTPCEEEIESSNIQGNLDVAGLRLKEGCLHLNLPTMKLCYGKRGT
jgi:hypothetical protein